MVPITLFAMLVIGFLITTDRTKTNTRLGPVFGLLLMLGCSSALVCVTSNQAVADTFSDRGVIRMMMLQQDGEKKPGGNTDDQSTESESDVDVQSNKVNTSNSEEIPDWVLTPADTVSEIEYVVVSTDPLLSPLDVEKDLDRVMENIVAERIDDLIRPGAGAIAGFSAEMIREKWLVPERIHIAINQQKIATMYRGYAQLGLDRDLYVLANERWTSHLKKQRLFQIGLVAGSILSVLAIVFSYFRIDNASQGLYTGRLQIFAIIFLLAVIGAAVHFGGQIDWF